ncbi:MAG: hypothetical protein OIF50_09135, partial [Flavobacteriaceae bacterium]|nr:hypothetical protein [Flavobacteriaceae bacterium]
MLVFESDIELTLNSFTPTWDCPIRLLHINKREFDINYLHRSLINSEIWIKKAQVKPLIQGFLGQRLLFIRLSIDSFC